VIVTLDGVRAEDVFNGAEIELELEGLVAAPKGSRL
jgi:hypothetical protein